MSHSDNKSSTGKSLKWLDQYCNACGQQLNSWDVRISKALAYKHPCCETCIANEYDQSKEELRAKFEDIFGLRPCIGL